MSVKCTSKASYLDIKEQGTDKTQAEKILEIIELGGTLSMQELMKIYRGKWGNIELSSVSARCNKLKEEGKIIEAPPRRCEISGKTVNPLTANKCTHDRYREKDYMCHPVALKSDNIAWVGKIAQRCKDCGADISFAKRAKVMTAEEYLKSINP